MSAIRAVGIALVVSALITVAVVGTRPAEAAFPGENGRITFSSNRDGDLEIFTVRPDGTGVKQLTRNKVDEKSSTFSPDGKKIVFVRDVLLSNGSEDREIFIMNADGTGARRLTFSSGIDEDPTFAPDGKKIAFSSELGIHTINPNGSGAKPLTDSGADGLIDWQANTAPTVTNLQPSPNSTTRDKTPTIRATVTDLQTNLAKANLRLTVDGKAVAETKFCYNASTDGLAFTTERKLPAGRHTVKVAAKDDVLLVGQSSWSFKVTTS